MADRAGIWRFSAAKTGQKFSDGERFATGIRNLTAFRWSVRDKALFGILHDRDMSASVWPQYFTLADELAVGDALYRIPRNTDFGWPYSYYDGVRNLRLVAPEYGGDGKKVAPPGTAATPVLSMVTQNSKARASRAPAAMKAMTSSICRWMRRGVRASRSLSPPALPGLRPTIASSPWRSTGPTDWRSRPTARFSWWIPRAAGSGASPIPATDPLLSSPASFASADAKRGKGTQALTVALISGSLGSLPLTPLSRRSAGNDSGANPAQSLRYFGCDVVRR
jgi:hypothetical protein